MNKYPFYTMSNYVEGIENITEDFVSLADIAHSLSNICRFNGHCKEFYSVAEHSILASNVVPQRLKLATLMHDAHEAYTGDIIRPVMQFIEEQHIHSGDEIKFLQSKIAKIILRKFKLGWLTSNDWDLIHKADDSILDVEVNFFFHNNDQNTDIISCLVPEIVEKLFLKEFESCLTQ